MGGADVRWSEAELDLLAASRDCWPRTTLSAWHGEPAVRPARIWWPESADEVAGVLAAASRARVAVVPYGAGSGVCGGATGREGAWVVDLKRLHRIGPLDETSWVVEVEAGVNGQQLEDWLAARGFTLGHSPSSISCSTVGGWAAARSAGQFSSRYGVFEDMVLGFEAVAPGVGAFRVGLGGDAPDAWMPLLLGSEGTLAVFTRFWLRVWPAPTSRRLRGYRFPDVASAVDAMRRLMQAELWPSVLRLYDPVDTRIGGKTKPKRSGGGAGWLRRMLAGLGEAPVVGGRALALPLGVPWLVNTLLDGVAAGALLVVGWEGDPAVVDACAGRGLAMLDRVADDLGEGPGQRWFHSRHAVSYKLMPVFAHGGFADTMEVACRWSAIEPTYDAVRAAVRPHAVVMAHMSHLYPEGGSIYFSFAGRGDRNVYDRLWHAAQDAVLAAGATVTHHHGVGRSKAPWATREVGPAVAGWRALAEELDPAGVMNPGAVFIDGTDAVPPASPPLEPEDGLAHHAPGELPQGAMWPWAGRPLPPWQRNPWQVGWTEVSARVGGVPCRLGRGPRSATGPDLRGWLAAAGEDVVITSSVAVASERWMGEARPERPWAIAQELLRADLRPAVLGVVDGRLRVGFRGPAAEALGAIASAHVPGGLEVCDWEEAILPAGPLVRCDVGHPDVAHVTLHHAWRRDGSQDG